MDIVSDVDKTYFKSQLKNNTELKGSVIKLAVCRSLKLERYKRFMAVEGVYEAIDDVLDILQLLEYIIQSSKYLSVEYCFCFSILVLFLFFLPKSQQN